MSVNDEWRISGQVTPQLGGASPLSVFEAIEAEVLSPLPDTPFVLARWSTAVVGPDIHIKVGRTLYSVPWKLIGCRVDVRSRRPWCRSSSTVLCDL